MAAHGYTNEQVAEGVRILNQDVNVVPIGTIKKEFLDFLCGQKISYKARLHVREILVHVKNRGGLLLNAHNAHRNGSHICRVGADLGELHGAVCFEMQPDPVRRQVRIAPKQCNRERFSAA